MAHALLVLDIVGCNCLSSQSAKQNSSHKRSDIIRSSHLTLYPSMFLGVSGLKKAFGGLVVSILLGLTLLSCGGYNSNTNSSHASGIARRAFVSNPVFPTGTGAGVPVLEIVDTSLDALSGALVTLQTALSGSLNSAGMMEVSPKRDRTLVFSASDTKLGIVSNGSESLSSAVVLPAPTESFIWTDNATVFVAMPAAPVSGQSTSGAVLRLDMPSGSTSATIPVPGAHYLVPSPDGSKVLVFSDNSDSVTLISPALLGSSASSLVSTCGATQVAVCTLSAGFSRPVGAVFDTSSTTAYVLNCGAQCGGTNAGACLSFTSCTSVSVLDMTQNPPVSTNSVAVPAATTALLQGNNLYVAGTPAQAPDNNCNGVTPTTAATTCGRLTVINVQSLTATSVAITDGYHNHMAITSNGLLFIGSHNCTNINVSGEVRGCLTIANVTSSGVTASAIIAPSDNGDVTGLAPVSGRNVVYVCEGGNLRVYDTTTSKLENLVTPPDIVGQAVDVKMVDF